MLRKCETYYTNGKPTDSDIALAIGKAGMDQSIILICWSDKHFLHWIKVYPEDIRVQEVIDREFPSGPLYVQD